MPVLHLLQHVPFEGLGSIESWATNRAMTVSSTRLFAGESLPRSLDGIQLLVIMGGPMSVHDESEYPWLVLEKAFIKDAIKAKIPIVGICLGGQLLSEALGGAVTKNEHREIGWGPVTRSKDCPSALSEMIPETFPAFHWHGETFDIPEGARRIASSEACRNQGFIWNNHVLALQFHMEASVELATELTIQCPDDLVPAPYVQEKDAMISSPERFQTANETLNRLLDAFMELAYSPGA